MACTNKILARKDNKTGLVKMLGAVNKFSPYEIKSLVNTTSGRYSYFKLPCGRCISCRLKKSKEWAIRCVHEAQFSSTACFITLTFDEERLYNYFRKSGLSDKKSRQKAKQCLWTLDVKLFQDFMKRLRKKVSPVQIRFFHCGEYGSIYKTCRPHHHAIIFGYDFPDKKRHSYSKLDNGDIVTYYTSELLDKTWNLGYSMITDCTENSCGYVARYTTKKVTGSLSDKHYNGRKPEYITMSRRPGIGYKWFEMYGMTDCYPQDFMLSPKDKFPYKPPKYYDKLLNLKNIEMYERVLENRLNFAKEVMLKDKLELAKEDTKERQEVNIEHNINKLNKLKRIYDNDKHIDDNRFVEYVNKCSAFGIPKHIVEGNIEQAKKLANKYIDAFTIANQLLDLEFGNKTYKDLN